MSQCQLTYMSNYSTSITWNNHFIKKDSTFNSSKITTLHNNYDDFTLHIITFQSKNFVVAMVMLLWTLLS